MAHPAKLAKAIEFHAQLTQAHEKAAALSAQLNQNVSRTFQVNTADTMKQAIEIGAALQKVACAERDCGSCYGINHTFSKSYDEMLHQHRLAFVDFERLSHELEANASPRLSDISALAADVERHLNLAEQAHQASFGLASLTNKY